MVDGVNNNFLNKYFHEVNVGSKVNTNNFSITERAIFSKVDENEDNILQQDEYQNLGQSKELSQEEKIEFCNNILGENDFEKLKINVNSIESVILIGAQQNKAVITIKPDVENNSAKQILIADISDHENPELMELRTMDSNSVEEICTFDHAAGTIKKRKGNRTDIIDLNERTLSVSQDNGSLGTVKIEYEYEDENSTVPKKAVRTDADGTKTELTGEDIPLPDNPFPVSPQAQNVKSSAQETVDSDSDSDTDTDTDSDSDTGSVDRSKPLYAKNGETFDATAKRLGFEKGTLDYNKFVAANKKAANRKWFVLSQQINIPDDLKDKVNAEAFKVDKKEEEQKYVQSTKDKADIKGYNGANTKERTLDRGTSWWMLAKQNLIDLGNQNPSNKEIYDRIGVLAALNEGKEPIAGTRLKIPTADPAKVSEAVSETGNSNSATDVEKPNLTEAEIAKLRELGCTEDILADNNKLAVWYTEKSGELATEVVGENSPQTIKNATLSLIYAVISHNTTPEIDENESEDNVIVLKARSISGMEYKITVDENNNPIKIEAIHNYKQGSDENNMQDVTETTIYSANGIVASKQVGSNETSENATIASSECNISKIMEYAKQLLEKAGVEPRSVQVAPQPPENQNPIPEEVKQQLKDLGIPDKVIEQGDEAIRNYAREYEIELPQRELPPARD